MRWISYETSQEKVARCTSTWQVGYAFFPVRLTSKNETVWLQAYEWKYNFRHEGPDVLKRDVGSLWEFQASQRPSPPGFRGGSSGGGTRC